MNITSVKYSIYKNLFKYLKIIGFTPVTDAKKPVVQEKSDFIKTLQFYDYVKIKAVRSGEKKKKETMYVFLVSDMSLVSRSVDFKKMLNVISEKETHLVIVSKKGIKTPVKKFLSKYTSKKLYVKDLLYENFKIDIRKNIMVPKHILCTPSETKAILHHEKLTSTSQLPKIRISDPQVLWVGGAVGDVIKIVRYGKRGEVPYYRVVVSDTS